MRGPASWWLVVLLALVAAACGDGADGTSPATVATTSTTTATVGTGTTLAPPPDCPPVCPDDTVGAPGTGSPSPLDDIQVLADVGEIDDATLTALHGDLLAEGDGTARLDLTNDLAGGASREVPVAAVDACRGPGYGAGADTTQPLGVGTYGGRDVFLFVFDRGNPPGRTTLAVLGRDDCAILAWLGDLEIGSTPGSVTTVP